jgi:hypothetical protein
MWPRRWRSARGRLGAFAPEASTTRGPKSGAARPQGLRGIRAYGQAAPSVASQIVFGSLPPSGEGTSPVGGWDPAGGVIFVDLRLAPTTLTPEPGKIKSHFGSVSLAIFGPFTDRLGFIRTCPEANDTVGLLTPRSSIGAASMAVQPFFARYTFAVRQKQGAVNYP